MALPYGKATNFTVNVTTASGVVLAANPNREYAILINDSDAVIYLGLGVAAALYTGIRLNASGGHYEMSRALGNLNQLTIYSIHGGTGNKVCCGVEGE